MHREAASSHDRKLGGNGSRKRDEHVRQERRGGGGSQRTSGILQTRWCSWAPATKRPRPPSPCMAALMATRSPARLGSRPSTCHRSPAASCCGGLPIAVLGHVLQCTASFNHQFHIVFRWQRQERAWWQVRAAFDSCPFAPIRACSHSGCKAGSFWVSKNPPPPPPPAFERPGGQGLTTDPSRMASAGVDHPRDAVRFRFLPPRCFPAVLFGVGPRRLQVERFGFP